MHRHLLIKIDGYRVYEHGRLPPPTSILGTSLLSPCKHDLVPCKMHNLSLLAPAQKSRKPLVEMTFLMMSSAVARFFPCFFPSGRENGRRDP
jgi:hypothetical protein